MLRVWNHIVEVHDERSAPSTVCSHDDGDFVTRHVGHDRVDGVGRARPAGPRTIRDVPVSSYQQKQKTASMLDGCRWRADSLRVCLGLDVLPQATSPWKASARLIGCGLA